MKYPKTYKILKTISKDSENNHGLTVFGYYEFNKYRKHKLTCLYLHGLWLNHVDLVPIATPDFVMHHSHAADGMVRPSKV